MRLLITLLVASGLALIYWSIHQSYSANVTVSTTTNESTTYVETKEDVSTVSQLPPQYETPASHNKSPNPKEQPSVATPGPEIKPSQSSNHEPYIQKYPEDSTKTLDQLKTTYAAKDLRSTLKDLVPETRRRGVGDEGVFRIKNGKLVAYRRNTKTDPEGTLLPESCISLRLPDGKIVVAEGKTGIKEFKAPDDYAVIVSINDTFYFLALLEYSRGRDEAQVHSPSAFFLYRKKTNGEIVPYGEFLRASINHQSSNDLFNMSARQFCESIPEPTPE